MVSYSASSVKDFTYKGIMGKVQTWQDKKYRIEGGTMKEDRQTRMGNFSEGRFFNVWFVVSIVITVLLIAMLGWYLFYSNEVVESFETRELAIQRISGELLRYTESLEMTAKMAAATGDLKWEIEYNDYRDRLGAVFDEIPELVESSAVLAEMDKIKEYREEIDQLEQEALALVARGEKGEAADLLAGWVYTGSQLEVIVATENLAMMMNNYIDERIARERMISSILSWVLAGSMIILVVSWYVSIQLWRVNVKKKQEKDREVNYLSYHDSLTGLHNRAYLEAEMNRIDNEEHLPVSVIMLDFNGLKLINDTYGHGVGDEILKKGAELLKNTCREEDVLARWGGDEFVIVLANTPQNATQSICKRIIEECRKTYKDGIPVSMALGTATKTSLKEDDLFKLLQEAEDQMYEHKIIEGRSARSATLEALQKTLLENSCETEEHTRKVEEISMLIADQLDLPDSQKSSLSLLAKLHDIGMIDVPGEVLTKPGSLSEDEWALVKKHPETGYRIACSTRDFAPIAEGILHHHECWDGSGYPEGLSGSEIPLLARIVAIADALEVMISGRPYKEARPLNQIVEELKNCAGKKFDPELVEIVLALLEDEDHWKRFFNPLETS